MCKIREWTKTLTDVVEMTKKEYVLTIAASLLGGIVIGFIFAPKRVKHTSIGCHNGSENKNNGNEYKDDLDDIYEEEGEYERLEDADDAPLYFN